MSKSAEQRAAEVLDYTVGMTDRHVRFVRQAEAISALKSAGLLASDEMLAVVEAARDYAAGGMFDAQVRYERLRAALDAYRASVKPKESEANRKVEWAIRDRRELEFSILRDCRYVAHSIPTRAQAEACLAALRALESEARTQEEGK